MDLVAWWKKHGKKDETTWITHALISFLPCLLLGIFSPLAAMVVARAILVVMAVREGSDWATKALADEDMKRATRDGVMDLAGPILNDVIWTVVAFYG